MMRTMMRIDTIGSPFESPRIGADIEDESKIESQSQFERLVGVHGETGGCEAQTIDYSRLKEQTD